MEIRPYIEAAGTGLDAVGVAVIVFGAAGSALKSLLRPGRAGRYVGFRQDLGRTILLGLELLVAADIVRTVAVEPTLRGVLILGVIVLIRTFLSVTLEVELEGRWPWQRGGRKAEAPEN